MDRPKIDNKEQIIVYDDNCQMCSYGISTLRTLENFGNARFVKRSSEEGMQILSQIPTASDSIVFIDDQSVTSKSDAIFALIKKKGGIVKVLLIFKFLPEKIRNRLYDFIARHRMVISRLFAQNPEEKGHIKK